MVRSRASQIRPNAPKWLFINLEAQIAQIKMHRLHGLMCFGSVLSVHVFIELALWVQAY